MSMNAELLQQIANPKPLVLPNPVQGMTEALQLKNLAQQNQSGDLALEQQRGQLSLQKETAAKAARIHQILLDEGGVTHKAILRISMEDPALADALQKAQDTSDREQQAADKQRFDLLNGSQAPEVTIPAARYEGAPEALQPTAADTRRVEMPLPKVNVGGVDLQPQSLQQKEQAAFLDFQKKENAKNVVLAKDARLVNQGSGATIATGMDTTSYEPKAGLLDGKPANAGFDKETNRYFVADAAGKQQDVTARFIPKEAQPSEFESTLADFMKHPDLVKRFGPDRIGFDKYKAQQKLDEAAAGRDAANVIPEIAPGSKEFKAAQDLAYGKLTFNDFTKLYSSRTPAAMALKAAIYQKAGDLNPNFNPAQFEMGYKLASSVKVQQQLASIDNVKAAVPDLLKLSDEASRTGITVLNNLISKGGFTLSDKHYANLATARTAFADELSGALGFGSATDMSREMGFDMTRPDLSPDAFRSQIQDVVIPFVERKKQTLLNQMGVYGQRGMQPGGGAAPPAVVAPALVNPYRVKKPGQ